MPSFKPAALRARLPVLAPAEKAALSILFALLASGAALRAWDRSGVSFGVVDDWESLRALVIRARAEDATPWPCAEAGFEEFGSAKGAKRASKKGPKDSGRKKPPAGVLDLNLAGERQLNTLPGVGPSTARAIVAWRTAHGPFSTPEELLNVKGIGPKKFEALRPFVKASSPRGTAAPEPATTASAPARNPLPDTVSRDPSQVPRAPP